MELSLSMTRAVFVELSSTNGEQEAEFYHSFFRKNDSKTVISPDKMKGEEKMLTLRKRDLMVLMCFVMSLLPAKQSRLIR